MGVVLQADGEPTLYHPGDAYDGEPGDVDVLAVPLNAPWARVAETIAFVRRVAPRQIIPIHDALLSEAGRRLYLGHVEGYGGDGLTVHNLTGGRAADITRRLSRARWLLRWEPGDPVGRIVNRRGWPNRALITHSQPPARVAVEGTSSVSSVRAPAHFAVHPVPELARAAGRTTWFWPLPRTL